MVSGRSGNEARPVSSGGPHLPAQVSLCFFVPVPEGVRCSRPAGLFVVTVSAPYLGAILRNTLEPSTESVSMRRVLALCLALVWVAACQSGRGPEPVTTTTDSAGVTIVTNLGPQWGEGEGWRLSEAPVLDLGTFDIEGPESFERVVGTRRLSSGVIVVAEGGAQELRFFDEGGSHIRTVG